MNREIPEYLEAELQTAKEEYKVKTTTYITITKFEYEKLQQENQQLKEINSFSKRELYKINKDRLEANLKLVLKLVEENKKLKEQYCERTDCVGRLGSSRKVERYKSVLDEIKETIKHYSSYKTDSGLLEYCMNDLLQILDKVKE